MGYLSTLCDPVTSFGSHCLKIYRSGDIFVSGDGVCYVSIIERNDERPHGHTEYNGAFKTQR